MTTIEKEDSAQAQEKAAKQKFFRQSSWMMIASVAAGAFMFAVHFFSVVVGSEEYGIFGTLLAMLANISIPGLGLQMVFAQQTAAVVDETDSRRLTGTMRGVLVWTLGIWLITATGAAIFHRHILDTLHISTAALVVTVVLAWVTMWKPVFYGVLQGAQNFLWLGWASILSGVGRLSAVAVIVLLLGGRGAGMMMGALLGELVALGIGIWRSRENWRGPSEPIQWRGWLGRVVPLTLGFGAFQFMFMIDPMFVRAFFDESQTGGYVGAGTLSRSLVLFTGPLAAVMFPKIVRSIASAQKTDMLKVTLLTTAVLAGLGAVFIAYIFPFGFQLFLKLFASRAVQTKAAFLVAGFSLLPPFAASMAVLTVANVLINNLLARGKFQVVPWLVVVVAAYALTLFEIHTSVEQVIYTLGGFSILMAGVALFFTWRIGNHSTAPKLAS